MKKIFAVFMALIIFTLPLSSFADVIGYIYKTDIKAYENYMQIPSYNCGGTTVVFARDLENYGYDILWDAESRTVEIIKNKDKALSPIVPSLEGDEPVGTILYEIYKTDIKTFFGGKVIPAYNIGGKVAVELRSLGNGKNITFDNSTRRAHLASRDIRFTSKEKTHIDYIYSVISQMTLLQSDLNDIFENANGGKFNSLLLSNLKSSYSELGKIIDEFEDYSQPEKFSESTMELWWAMTNLHLAADIALKNQKALKGEDANKYNRYMTDCENQMQKTLTRLAGEF